MLLHSVHYNDLAVAHCCNCKDFILCVCVCVCGRVVVYANGTLQISQVKQRSTGVYKCVAQYGENKQVHVEAALRIAGERRHTRTQRNHNTHTHTYTDTHMHTHTHTTHTTHAHTHTHTHTYRYTETETHTHAQITESLTKT